MKDRLLNILLLTFIFLLIANFFLPKPQKAEENGEVHFALQKADVTVPNLLKADIVNPTNSGITLNTCKDMQILKDFTPIKIDQNHAFCKDLTVPAHGKTALDFSPLATSVFANPGDYGLKLTLNGKDITTKFSVEERGLLRTFLATVFYAPVLNLFVFLLDALPGHSLGLAIIVITLIVRLILLVPQHHMLVNARHMQEIQPKIKALQEKYKNDQAKMGMELMELYKKEGVNPLGSCLPLLIQMPILIVLYWVLTSISDASNHYYFYPIFSSFDVAKISTHFIGLDLLAMGGYVGAALAVLVGAAQWLQIKLSQANTAKSKKETKTEIVANPDSMMPDPELMNKFMLWGMPVMIAISTYYFPAGVGIYWLIGTLFMLVQQVVANKLSARKRQ